MENNKSNVNNAVKNESMVNEVLTPLLNGRPSPPPPLPSPPPPSPSPPPPSPPSGWGLRRHRTIRVEVGAAVNVNAFGSFVENQIRRSIRIRNRLISSKSKDTSSSESCHKAPSSSKRGKAKATPFSSKPEKSKEKSEGAKVSVPKKTYGLKILEGGDNQEVEASATVPSNSEKAKAKVEGAKVRAPSKKRGLEIREAEDNQQFEEATMPTIEELVVQHGSLMLKKCEIQRAEFSASKEIEVPDVREVGDDQQMVETTMATTEEHMVQNEHLNAEHNHNPSSNGEIVRKRFRSSKENHTVNVHEAGDNQEAVETTMATIEEHMVQNESLDLEKSPSKIQVEEGNTSEEIEVLDVLEARDNQEMVEITGATTEDHMMQNDSPDSERGLTERTEFNASMEIEVPDVCEAGDDQQMVETTMTIIEENMVQNESLDSEMMQSQTQIQSQRQGEEVEQMVTSGQTQILEISNCELQEVSDEDTEEFVSNLEETTVVDKPNPDEDIRFLLPDLNLPYVDEDTNL